jgi:hypothetical protein
MSNEINTPAGLEPNSEGVNEWVRYQLVRIFDRTKAIEGKLDDVRDKQKLFDAFMLNAEVRLAEGVQRFINIDKQIEYLKDMKKDNPATNNKSITFQWLLEKLALPVIMLIIGGAIALLFK